MIRATRLAALCLPRWAFVFDMRSRSGRRWIVPSYYPLKSEALRRSETMESKAHRELARRMACLRNMENCFSVCSRSDNAARPAHLGVVKKVRP